MLTWNIGAATRGGAATGIRMVVGHAAVELPLVVALAIGLGAVVQRPDVLGAVALLGALVLFWMAYGTLRSVPGLPEPLAAGTSVRDGFGWRSALSAGALLSLSNPYFLLWWATVGAGFIGQALQFSVLGLAVFYAGHILSDFGWYGAVSLAVSKGMRFLNRRAYQVLMAALGAGLLLLGLLFLAAAFERLMR